MVESCMKWWHPQKLKLNKNLVECPFCHQVAMREERAEIGMMFKRLICNDCECWFYRSE